jgi:hypothetical protein
MAKAQTINELITVSYTLSRGEFLAEYSDPMLVGVVMHHSRLSRSNAGRANTMAMVIPSMESTGGDDQPPFLGRILPLCSQGDEKWARLAIGRSDENDVVIDDPAVSEFHCYIRKDKKEYLLADLGSTNGTKVNGEPLKAPQFHSLTNSDVITLGRCSFQFFRPRGLLEFLDLGLE